MRFILLIATILIAFQPALATNSKGVFMTGGGVGSLSCPVFLNDMALARQRGGVTSREGVMVINPFTEYFLGFRTAYNLVAPGVYDAFGSLGDDVATKALFWIDAWCTKHPEKTFDTGIFSLLKTLRDNSQVRQ